MDIIPRQYICDIIIITIKPNSSVLGTGPDTSFGLSNLILSTTL